MKDKENEKDPLDVLTDDFFGKKKCVVKILKPLFYTWLALFIAKVVVLVMFGPVRDMSDTVGMAYITLELAETVFYIAVMAFAALYLFVSGVLVGIQKGLEATLEFFQKKEAEKAAEKKAKTKPVKYNKDGTPRKKYTRKKPKTSL